MKTLKFRPHLVSQIESGTKTITWRLFDDKNLQVGDQITFLNWETGQPFAEANLTDIRSKSLGQITDTDYDGHEPFKDHEEMMNNYRKYYGSKVDENTVVKIIGFKISKFIKP